MGDPAGADFIDRCALSIADIAKDHPHLYCGESERQLEGRFLIGWRGSLYGIDGGFDAMPLHSSAHAIGSGEGAARGALFATDPRFGARMDAQRRLVIAVQAAADVHAGIGGGIDVMVDLPDPAAA